MACYIFSETLTKSLPPHSKRTHSTGPQTLVILIRMVKALLERVFDPRPVVTPNPTQPNIASPEPKIEHLNMVLDWDD